MRILKVVSIVLVAIAAVGVGAVMALDREKKDLTAVERVGAPGAFIQLRDGITHYEIAGSDTARTVVLLSGASVPFYIWDPTFGSLVANGYRVLRYNYYGRGFSDRPKLKYDLPTYDVQLTELLDSLGIRGRIDIAGVSMGCRRDPSRPTACVCYPGTGRRIGSGGISRRGRR